MKDYFAEIDAWKKRKDDEAYQAKIKEENEYWDAKEKLKQFYPKIEEACKIAQKCRDNKIDVGDFFISYRNVCFFSKLVGPNDDENVFFGMTKRDSDGRPLKHLIVTKDGLTPYRTSARLIEEWDDYTPSAYEINKVIKNIPDFLLTFYDFLDKKLKE